jgi:hypothetical protein
MTLRELQTLIEQELPPDSSADEIQFAADLAQLAAVGLVDIARAPSGELRVAARVDAGGGPRPTRGS